MARRIGLAMLAAAGIGLALLPVEARAADGIDRAVRAAMAQTASQGVALATIDRGQVRSVRTYGLRNAAGQPLTRNTVMYGASLTKAVFAYLVVQLAAEGRLDLDRPIAALLPKPIPDYGNLEDYGNWGDLAGDDRWRAITPRMALNHSTGFANFAFLEPDRRLRFHFDPGTRYGYSGEGISLLQFGIEQGLGLGIETEMQRRFFGPLGLTRTSLIWQRGFASDLADGWDEKGRTHPHDERSRVRAAGSMDTTIADLAKLVAMMARGDGMSPDWRRRFVTGTQAITTASQFPTIQPDAPPADRPAAKAGLGIIAFDGPQGPGWVRGGHNDVTANILVCLERRQRCVLILSNDVRTETAFPALVRAALGETGAPFRWLYPGLPAY